MEITVTEDDAGATTATDSRNVIFRPTIQTQTKPVEKRSPEAYPAFFRDNFPPELSPKIIRSTKVLPLEVTSREFSARSISELYCLEVV